MNTLSTKYKESTRQIWERDIDSLTCNINNRAINANLRKQLVNSFKAHGFRTELPIWITRDGVIIDGHHRYFAAIDAGLESVPTLIVDRTFTFDSIIKVTSTTRRWTQQNWMEYYTSTNKDCALFIECMKDYNLSYAGIYRLLLKASPGGFSYETIKNGKFKFPQDTNFEILGHYTEISNLGLACSKTTVFIDAFTKIYNHSRYDHSRMVQKLCLQNTQTRLQAGLTKAAYISILNDIYNKNMQPINYIDLRVQDY